MSTQIILLSMKSFNNKHVIRGKYCARFTVPEMEAYKFKRFLPKVLQLEIEEQRFEPRQTSSMILLNYIT